MAKSNSKTAKAMKELKAIQKAQRKLERREAALVKIIARERDKFESALAACKSEGRPTKKRASKKRASKKRATKKRATKKRATKKQATKKAGKKGKGKAPPHAELRALVLKAMTKHKRPSTGLVFIPGVVKELSKRLPPEETKRVLYDMAINQEIELRPEGGLNRLSKDEKALSIPGPQGTLLAWARITR